MKIFFDDDIKIHKRLILPEHMKFMKDHAVYLDGYRKIQAQKCVFNNSADGEKMMAIVSLIAVDYVVEYSEPNFVGDHLDVRYK